MGWIKAKNSSWGHIWTNKTKNKEVSVLLTDYNPKKYTTIVSTLTNSNRKKLYQGSDQKKAIVVAKTYMSKK